ncbi:hypothetical protein EVB32_340 [Rhizobium phage RHph_TM39]|uniref:Uncharacterized protein n=2 Tax=Cuauhnahuacvirus TaxID=3044696 RepID=A0A7S5R882_9CAUD|nr:hypothetical protein PQC16_gp296 [Rhizobium phage RHph_TM30]YP_010671493.1 hypothetical protein PQC17_gp297 [Rhizobium phage RHph_Y65]QIG71816.1 hypothetical protein EVB94_365 [Rhizobium phage RHph_TM40]QIG72176.1 hypothetical protein EVB95_363 [Rhizobium phage RHph_TM2_3B]QIG72539.1 hypothetical protein EVB96_363 [Rhizobium phage RHph_TM3_3_6]QIG77308.1 hypothetical protein EVB32_340 [Rhizobium phage RHph_TM39]QIG71452.1 hypothetical protein EVB93_365 [Rhizobium phage RHph_TM30]
MTKSLYVESLKKNGNATVMIAGPGRAITALVEADFGFDITSEFSDADSASLGEAASKFLNAATNPFGMTQRVVKSLQQTLSRWNGSSKPTFVIPITLITYNRNVNIFDDIKYLYGGVTPEYSFPLLQAPYGYSSKIVDISMDGWTPDVDANVGEDSFRNSLRGTWSIQYANWFRASRLVLMSVSTVFSKETVKGTNKPLYAKVTLQFQPAILPTKKEVQGWFLDNIR